MSTKLVAPGFGGGYKLEVSDDSLANMTFALQLVSQSLQLLTNSCHQHIFL